MWPDSSTPRPSVTDGGPPGAWPEGFVRGPDDRDALIVLAHLETMTPAEVHALAWRERSAARCLAALRRGQGSTKGDRAIAEAVDPSEVRERLVEAGARAVFPGEPEYPARLLELHDPPVCLFLRGAAVSALSPTVAIVGARRCTPYGWEVAEALGAGLASARLVVVSGAARGVDGAAHLGALRVGGPTVAVLGSGIDVAYPRNHRKLIDRIAASGSVVSEYPPGVEARPRRFPARNRIVAALSHGVVVVEGAEGSGSLITAEFAGDLHREVMAVPGPVTGPLSAAPHELIRDGATLVTSVDQVLAALGMPEGPGRSGRTTVAAQSLAGLSEEERGVLDHLSGAPATIDVVAAGCGLDAPRTLRALAGLELRGLVRSEGGRYRRTGLEAGRGEP